MSTPIVEYKLYYVSLITDWTIHNIRPDIVIIKRTIKEAYLINVAISSSHNHHREALEIYRLEGWANDEYDKW